MTPPNKTERLPNTYVRQFFRFLGCRQSLLHGMSETVETLTQIGGSNSFSDYCQFFRNARDQFDQPDIGLVLGRVNQLANMHGPLSTALYQSSDIRDCLQLLERFTPLRLPLVQIQWVEDESYIGLQVEFTESGGDIQTSVTETLLLTISSVIAAVSQGMVLPSRIELDYPRPPYSNKYRDAFGISFIWFSCPDIRVLIDKTYANFQTDTDQDPQLRASAIQRCEELLRGTVESHSFSDRIKQIFANNPGHLWTLRDVSRHLGMSDRTLQRRLTEEGSRYHVLHSEWLKGEARQLLGEQNLSIESVSMLLGYSDVSNFRHACRRWYGKSPLDLRQELDNARPDDQSHIPVGLH